MHARAPALAALFALIGCSAAGHAVTPVAGEDRPAAAARATTSHEPWWRAHDEGMRDRDGATRDRGSGTSDTAAKTVAKASYETAATDDTGDDAREDRCAPLTARSAPPAVMLFQLRAAAFPGSAGPSVAVHVPPGFDPSHRPGLIAFFHGFENCVANVVGDVDSPCSDGGEPRESLHLADQIDAAHVNAILVAIELQPDSDSSDPGRLAEPGAFRALLHELFAEHLDAVLGCRLDVDDLDRVVVSSHSGGYRAAASAVAYGEVPSIREIDLLDSLYGEREVFDDWIVGHLGQFDRASHRELRWRDVYTDGGETAGASREMAADTQSWLDTNGLGASELFDDTTDTLDEAAYAHPILFKRSEMPHLDVPRYYVYELARSAGFARIR